MCDLTRPEFNDKDIAREYLESIRWPEGPVCPHCGCYERISRITGKSARPGLMFCGDCRKQFTVTTGTVFHGSHVPLNKWVLTAHLMCASKKGISAHQIHRMIGVTYKTAWFMCHRIREAMKEDGGLMGQGGGTVEVDETNWGNQSGKPVRRGYGHKMTIVTLVERGGRARSQHVPAVNGATLAPIMKEQLASDAHLMTDEARVYTSIGKNYASHGVVQHGIYEYVRGEVHSNTIEGFFSILKRGLVGTYHHVGEQHLKRYACEFDFRYNYRTKMGYTDRERAEVALKGIVGKRLLYRDSLQAI